MEKRKHKIQAVDPGSIAEELELEAGDFLLAINGNEIEDIFDYEYYVGSESMVMLVEKADGELWELEIENEYEDLGITFENGLMSEYKSCSNRCIFCFIDQMPPGMRKTLYFKDDDSRLSFLQGNYITLTNMKDPDIERIIRFKLAPINISVHTTNPKLRCEMLHNRFAGEALKKMDTLFEAQVPMNGQIVLCRGINDGRELERTIRDLAKYLPVMESVSVVPVGLSKFREGLYPLEPFDKESAAAALKIIEQWQEILYEKWGNHFVHASDEFYILAGRELPEEGRYDNYPQLENGVGMLRLLDSEVTEALQPESRVHQPKDGFQPETMAIATGELAYPYVKKQVEKITRQYPQKQVYVYAVRNEFFGEQITVAGLLTGQDIIGQLAGRELGERLLLPVCMFRSGEEVFLDDVTREEVQSALQVPVNIVKSGGRDLVRAILGLDEEAGPVLCPGYELREIDGKQESRQ
ncbi:MAG: DUF512 domain-containing protein [Lachnospiraceae bacterium]|nr:DUF512 domain-containing protein [Lachnospiraceae bacterium]